MIHESLCNLHAMQDHGPRQSSLSLCLNLDERWLAWGEKYGAAGWRDWNDAHQLSSEGVFKKNYKKASNQLLYVMARLTFSFRVQLQWFGCCIYKQDRWQELGEGVRSLFN